VGTTEPDGRSCDDQAAVDDVATLEEDLGIILDQAVDPAVRDRAMRDREPEDWKGPAAQILGSLERLVTATRLADPPPFDDVRHTVLLRVCERGSVPLGRIAQLEPIGRSTLTRSVTALARAGLVERVIDPDDRRHLLIRATPAGRQLADKVMQARCVTLARELRVLMADDVVALVHAARCADLLASRISRPPWQWRSL
jgi:DNA-binding MarR family transcriptional regulator